MTTPLKKLTSSLFLQGLEFDVHLGWPDEERKQQQKVLLDIELRFLHPPRACSTDDLADTHCYDQLAKNIMQHLSKREFRLMEHLGKELYQYIKHQFHKQEVSLNIRITKRPPIANLRGGVSFCYGDSHEGTAWSS